MNYMVRWAGGFLLSVRDAKGAEFTCENGKHFINYCHGDTGVIVRHSPEKLMQLIAEQMKKGFTFMLPTEDAIWLGEELQRCFGLKYWQTTLTATDSNHFVLRLARHFTKLPLDLIFDFYFYNASDCWSLRQYDPLDSTIECDRITNAR